MDLDAIKLSIKRRDEYPYAMAWTLYIPLIEKHVADLIKEVGWLRARRSFKTDEEKKADQIIRDGCNNALKQNASLLETKDRQAKRIKELEEKLKNARMPDEVGPND